MRLLVLFQCIGIVSCFSSIRPSSVDFDFSSARGWESHYQESSCHEAYDEWHTTIDFGTIVQYCVPAAIEDPYLGLSEKDPPLEEVITMTNKHDTSNVTAKTDILMVGCGTSRLPEAFDPEIYQLTLLDAAPTCIEALRNRYTDCDHHRYIVGDAVRMTQNNTGVYDCVVDKGLMDALLCGEGWDVWVAQLVASVANVLRAGGRYVLVSYRLPTSTVRFLEQRSHGKLAWDFCVDGSNPRVMISIARRLWYDPTAPNDNDDEMVEPSS